MYNKYEILLNILDKISLEAPLENKFYRPSESDYNFLEKKNQARSRALIHLYLKVKFWLLDFKDREKFVTDGAQDGWIDWYYIDTENKKIYIIQAKFRTSVKNFEEKEIDYDELLCMDINLIRQWKEKNEEGIDYNWKIKGFQREISLIQNPWVYEYVIVILANIWDRIEDSSLKKLTDWFNNILRFNYDKVYSELVFPMVNWTYFNSDKLRLNINLTNVKSWASNINYALQINNSSIGVRVFYVPTEEVAKILLKYKNSILTYNPRSYLDMRSWHVNYEIYNSIVESKNNEFSLYNNWITLLANEVTYTDSSWIDNIWVVHIVNPQILNWWQTSYTLSLIYEKVLQGKLPKDIFNWKDVLLKIIKIEDFSTNWDIIEKISRATNNQSFVTDSDRKSNDSIQLDLQKKIYEKYWLFYERKIWEFWDWIKEKYIDRDIVLKRDIFLKMSLCAQFPSNYIWDSEIDFKNPKNTTESWLFSKEIFSNILGSSSFSLEKAMYNYFIFLEIKRLKKEQREDSKDKDWFQKYGNALRYWELALIMVNGFLNYKKNFSLDNIRTDFLKTLWKWKDFDNYVKIQETNINYFNQETSENNFYWYYKSQNLLADLREYFSKTP